MRGIRIRVKLTLYITAFIGALVFVSPRSKALNYNDFKPGRIIDDVIFTDKSSMNVDQIQAFLNSKVNTCEKNRPGFNITLKRYRDTQGREVVNSARFDPPYTCLKDYQEHPTQTYTVNYSYINTAGVIVNTSVTKKVNNSYRLQSVAFEYFGGNPANGISKSIASYVGVGGGNIVGAKTAAQIINDSAQTYNINPQVLITTLEKETSLITDTWAAGWQYDRAMGWACPDSGIGQSANCDASKEGFMNQVMGAGWQFRNDFNGIDKPGFWSPFGKGLNNIRYSERTDIDCGSRQVNIENQSTAVLYKYTPYTPNDAAILAAPGVTVSCGAYGNRNFWRFFNAWFGRTTVLDPYDWEVIKTETDARYFLVVGNTKRHIPTSDIYLSWKLDHKAVKTVSQAYFDNIPTIPALGRLGFLEGRYYFIDRTKRITLTNETIMKAWGLYGSRAVAAPLYSIIANLTDGGAASNYISDSSGQTFLMTNGKKYAIDGNFSQNWQANPSPLANDTVSEFESGPNITNKVSINSVWFIADSNRLIKIESSDQARSWGILAETFTPIDPSVLDQFATESFNRILRSSDSPHWFLTIDGKKSYLPTLDHAKLWNVLNSSPITVTLNLFNSIPDTLTPTPIAVKASSSSDIYVLDGQKRKLSSSIVEEAFIGTKRVEEVSQQTLDTLLAGSVIDTPFIRSPSGNIFVMSSGEGYYIRNTPILNALGYPRKYSTLAHVSQTLTNILFNGKEASGFIKSGDVMYYMQSGYAYPLKNELASNWLASRSPVDQSSTVMTNRYDVLLTQRLGNIIQEGSETYVMSDGVFVRLDRSLINSSAAQQVSTYGYNISASNGLLAMSTVASDRRVWLLNNGTKQHVLSAGTFNAFRGSTRLEPFSLSPSALESFSTIAGGDVSTLIISSQGYKLLTPSGFIALVNASAAEELRTALIPLVVSTNIFNQYPTQAGTINRLLRAADGKIYILQNGTKRWILSRNSLISLMPFGPIIDLNQDIVNTIPNGQIIP